MTKDSKTIPLTQGKHAIVDAEDYEWLSLYKWQYCNGYAVRSIRLSRNKGKTIRMHRLLMNDPLKEVDHINQDALDNRKSNLREATRAENAQNIGITSRNKSGYIGVSWRKSHKKWLAGIRHNGQEKFIGYFSTPIEAAMARDKEAKKLHGEFAVLNFGGTNG